MELTADSLQSILEGNEVNRAILKVENLKQLVTPDRPIRYRLLVTDGKTKHSYVTLALELNELVDNGQLQAGCFIRLEQYNLTGPSDKKCILISKLEVLSAENKIIPEQSQIVFNKQVDNKVMSTNVTNQGEVKAMPINLINSYQKSWTIKGRVTKKLPLKTYSNTRGEGKLFNFILCDTTCDVKITAFNMEATKYFDMIEVDKTYSISKGMVKAANAKYNDTKCDFEISLTSETMVNQIQDKIELPKMQFEFVTFDKISLQEPNTIIDVVGVAHNIGDVSTIIVKQTNKELLKREISLVDQSGHGVRLTLWAETVSIVDNVDHPVIVIKNVNVKDFNGRFLSCGNNSTILVNPADIPDAMKLLEWYNNYGSTFAFQTQTVGGSFAGVQIDSSVSTIDKLSCNIQSDKGDYFTILPSISQFRREGFAYKGCKCNRKLVDLQNGMFRCEKCNLESPDYEWKLMLKMNIIDQTGSQWVTCFQQAAEKILGTTANAIGEMVELEQKDALDKIFKDATFKTFPMKVRVKNDTYNDEARLNVSVVDCKSEDVLESIRGLISLIVVK